MPSAQRVAQYIQDFAYKSLLQHAEPDVRPNDVAPRAAEPTATYSNWNASSFSDYAPFRSPTNG